MENLNHLYVGKKEDEYNIRLFIGGEKANFEIEPATLFNRAKIDLVLKITDAETDEPVVEDDGDNKENPNSIRSEYIFTVKSSWTEEELTDKINRMLLPYGTKLSTTYESIQLKQQKVNNTKQENENTDKSINGLSLQDVLNYINTKEFESMSKEEKLKHLDPLIKGANKMGENILNNLSKLEQLLNNIKNI